MNNNGKLTHAAVIMIALSIALIYSAAVFASALVYGSDRGKSVNTVQATASTSPYDVSGIISETAASDVSGILSSLESSGSSLDLPSDSTASLSEVSSSSEASVTTSSSVSSTSSSSAASSEGSQPDNNPIVTKSFSAAIWFSFGQDLNFKNCTEAQFKAKINTMFDNAKALGCDAVICQVRPFADAYYYSQYFPISAYLSGTQGKDPGYDAMKYMISAAHSRGLQFHAWLNPYRISSSTNNVNTLDDTHPAKIWANDGDPSNDRYYLTCGNGLYFNPTVTAVQELIINGVREILENYDVDGIHIDDYFYPTTDAEFDLPEYNTYTANGGKLSQSDWRRANVDALVSGIYREVHKHSGVVFGVSPSYHISNNKTDENYNSQYADIAKWMKTDGFIDYIAPQLYFGYNYPNEKIQYSYLLDLWMSISRKKSVKIYIGLAAYKIGDATADKFSGEWVTDKDILARQALDASRIGCDGVFIFNYSTLFAEDALTTAQRQNLKQALNDIETGQEKK